MTNNNDFNTTILYSSQYPGYINTDLDDEHEKIMVNMQKEALNKLKNNNDDDDMDDINNIDIDNIDIDNIYIDGGIINNNDIDKINMNNVSDDDDKDDDDDDDDDSDTDYKLTNTQYKIENDGLINKYDNLNTYENIINNIPVKTLNTDSDRYSIKIDSIILNRSEKNTKINTNYSEKKKKSNILITNKYGYINTDEKIIVLENENKLLKQKIINTETKKMNDFYNIFVNPNSNIITIKNYILNYSREINNELTMFDLNSLEDDKIYILYKAIKELKKKSSQIELSAHIIKIVLFLIETTSTKFLQTNVLKNISKDLNVESDFNNTQQVLNNVLTIPEFPFKDIISHIVKKACINIGYEFGYEKLLNSIN
jgi:hypothetical protein